VRRVWGAAFALIILLNWAVPAYAQSGLVAAVLPASRAVAVNVIRDYYQHQLD
jgi:hypothetical protein